MASTIASLTRIGHPGGTILSGGVSPINYVVTGVRT